MDSFFAKHGFLDVAEKIRELPIDRITKPDLGKLGLPALEGALAQLSRETKIISSVLDDASLERIKEATDAYNKYVLLLYDVIGLSATEFVNKRVELGEALGEQWDRLRNVWPYFAALAISRTGIIEDPDGAYHRIVDAAEKGQSALTALADDVISRARTEASKIEEQARKTARNFSVQAAQNQFNDASKSLMWKAIFWGFAAAALFGWFIAFAFHVYNHPPEVFSGKLERVPYVPEMVYFTVLRLTILTAIGTIATFCLRMLRAHLHMSALNNHRRRVANSMAAFVEAAHSPSQRDSIFQRLVDAVIAFGDSGLLDKESDGISVPGIAIDAVTKNLSSKE